MRLTMRRADQFRTTRLERRNADRDRRSACSARCSRAIGTSHRSTACGGWRVNIARRASKARMKAGRASTLATCAARFGYSSSRSEALSRRSTLAIIRSRAEGAIEPIGAAESHGKPSHAVADAILDQNHALAGPGFVAFQNPGSLQVQDRRLYRVERGKHPSDRARPGVRIVRQKAGVARCDVKHDGARLEQGKIAFFMRGICPNAWSARCAASFIALNETRPTS